MTTTINKTPTIRVNDKFVCSWGYDQTQVSVYEVVSAKGQFVTVRGLNSWSNLGGYDMAVGSKIKVYNFKEWNQLSDEERADYESRNFNFNSYNYHMRKEADENAPVRTIVKTGRINGDQYSYRWELDNGDVVTSENQYGTDQRVTVVDGLKRCRLNTKYGTPSIRIDSTIFAHHDPDYDRNEQRYADQNEYTAYNGR